MKKRLFILFLITGCSNSPTSSGNFDATQFTAVAKSTMFNLIRTRPVDYSAKQPFKELEKLCADYSFSPEEQKTKMMNILAQANYDDPMWSEHVDDSATLNQGAQWDTVRVRQSRINADFAYQMCMNAYRENHGQKFVPVTIRDNKFYENANWSQ